MVPLHQNPVVMPLVRGELLHRHLLDDPRLALGIDDHLLAGVGKNAATLLLVEHPVVVRVVGHDVALVAGHHVQTEIGPRRAAVLDPAVAAGG